MSILSLFFFGPPEQRVKVSVSPMAKLSTVLEEACNRLKPALDPSLCELILHEGRNKLKLDLKLPFRLANIPKTAKLEVVQGQTIDSLSPNHISLTACAADAKAVSQAVEAKGISVKVTSASQQTLDPIGQPIPSLFLPETVSTSEASIAEAGPDVVSGRKVAVYTQAALEAATAEAAKMKGDSIDMTDDFYDVTPDDIAWVTKSSGGKKGDGQLLTKALRDAAELRRAAVYGPIPVRIHFPDNIIVQAAFSALDTIAALQDLVAQVLTSDLSVKGAFYLYTTPPRQVLKDSDVTLFKAQLVPAAHVYVHVVEGRAPNGFQGPYLKSSVLSLMQDSLDLFESLPGQAPFVGRESIPTAEASCKASDDHDVLNPSEDESKKRGGPSGVTYTTAGTKVPKWLKMGK
ncbi:hypothetical protein CEUSTIGMA_g11493.t1 [Chlamydomonas eustigma]|uniref:UBX domain-containing protein n=1 Tax=Chlamydomonas eustigma TaxID=1157962 RepID=A0A250XMC0_9CHLO|nr:hypothetical protein CEUSTIGMA_g11493.t1 [Chlamydomonas eustigma]|eukprot:GAX84069.1 hypothetical protein CEUSTIGMA_g11493.t1 [Chlamydomonas eustigma]